MLESDEVLTPDDVRKILTHKNSGVKLLGEVHTYRLPEALFSRQMSEFAHTANFIITPKGEHQIKSTDLDYRSTEELRGVLADIRGMEYWRLQFNAQTSSAFYAQRFTRDFDPNLLAVQFPWIKVEQEIEGTRIARRTVAEWDTTDPDLLAYAAASGIGRETSQQVPLDVPPQLDRRIMIRLMPNDVIGRRVLAYEQGVQDGTVIGWQESGNGIEREYLRRGLTSEMLDMLKRRGNHALVEVVKHGGAPTPRKISDITDHIPHPKT